MNIDFDLVLSVTTLIIAAAALFQSYKQIKLSNKQHLFDRRKKVYIIFIGLFTLIEENINSLKKEVNSRIIYEDILFKGLVNNSYLNSDCNIITDIENNEYKIKFLTKMEELHDIAIEAELIFPRKISKHISDFITEYKKTLMQIYKYQIIIDKIFKINEDFKKAMEKHQQDIGEQKHQKKLIEQYKLMLNSYNNIISNDVVSKLKKEIKL